MKYLILLLLVSSCQSYDCISTNGKPLAEIEMKIYEKYLTSESVQQICEIIRKDMKK